MALNIQNTSLKISAGLPKQFPSDPIPQVAFSGRSNVGKSSLYNRLLGREAAIVTDIEGTTRDVLRQTATLGKTTLCRHHRR